MIVKVIYLGTRPVHRVYHNGEIIFQGGPVVFHVVEDGKLIILGALTANSQSDGLYLDCDPDTPDTPDVEWIYPVKNGGVLTIEQVYNATVRNHVMEVE